MFKNILLSLLQKRVIIICVLAITVAGVTTGIAVKILNNNKQNNNLINNSSPVENNNESKEINTYQVNFDFGDELNNIVSVVNENGTVEKPEDPVKEGYTFINWYLNDTIYDFSNPVVENITIVAKWEKTKKEEETVINKETVNSEDNNKQQDPAIEEVKYCNVHVIDFDNKLYIRKDVVECGTILDSEYYYDSVVEHYKKETCPECSKYNGVFVTMCPGSPINLDNYFSMISDCNDLDTLYDFTKPVTEDLVIGIYHYFGL